MNVTKALALIFGGVLGAALVSDDDEQPDLGLGGTVLHLERGESVPPTVEQIDKVTTCWATEVPDQLTREWDWRRLEENARVSFFPKSLIRSVRLLRSGNLYATVEGTRDMEVKIGLLQVGKARRHLERAGYPLHY